MPVKINVNDLTLAHKGSNGTATATLPDMCKTPSPGGPVPLPYPNIAMSSDLAKGTSTIKVDGGNMAANKGSEFSRSSGDEAGTAGGVTSSTFIKEATWMLYSFDVMLEGKNACRLTDKMFMNHQNTVCLAGEIQAMIATGMTRTDACAQLYQQIDELTGEGQTGHNARGIRGLENRRNEQIHGGGGGANGAPNAPFDRLPNDQLGFPAGSNPWMRHDHELQREQNRLAVMVAEYDAECQGEPPLRDAHYEQASAPAPQMHEWQGPWHPATRPYR
jgi:hypothetical protein